MWYKAFINGEFYGIALHVIPEPYNESYEYEASSNLSENEEFSSETKYKISESDDDMLLNNDLNGKDQRNSMQNPESSNEPFSNTKKRK